MDIAALLNPVNDELRPTTIPEYLPFPITCPQTPHPERLIRDQRRDILLMRSLGFTYKQIASHLNVTERAVAYSCKKMKATPQHKNAGRPARLQQNEVDKIIDFMRQSRRTRQMTANQLAFELFPDGDVSGSMVDAALKKRGYNRRIALRKPALTPAHRRARLKWVEEHVNWTIKQWEGILWSDKTWVTSGQHRKAYVWRLDNEVYEDSCLVDKIQRKQAWMFWGSFHGDSKGPCQFWDRNEMGTISAHTYCSYVLPLLVDYFAKMKKKGVQLIYQQDGASSHTANSTKTAFKRMGISTCAWPAKSPDLNPIETLWNIMKDWIAKHYPEYSSNAQYNRRVVTAAWDAIGQDTLRSLLATIKQRYQDIIDTKGSYTH
jgi:transposase